MRRRKKWEPWNAGMSSTAIVLNNGCFLKIYAPFVKLLLCPNDRESEPLDIGCLQSSEEMG